MSSAAKTRSRSFRFFGGKGGVGKTTCAAARAIASAERRGAHVLVLSTDPAHSLGDALELDLSSKPVRVPGVRGGVLEAVELDAAVALERWLGGKRTALRIIAERGTYFDREDLDQILDLSLPGVDELIGLVEIMRTARASSAQEIIVDTAPTGHTLRLFEMPETIARIAEIFDAMQAKHRFLKESIGGSHGPDATDDVIRDIGEEGHALAALVRDPARCRFTWITNAEPLAVAETLDGIRALEALGISVDELIINRLTPGRESCAFCGARRAAEAEALEPLAPLLRGRKVIRSVREDQEPRGVKALRTFALESAAGVSSPAPRAAASKRRPRPKARDVLLELIPLGAKLIFVGGKGGVGKTTIAASLALACARRDPEARILVLSTDPAHSLGDAFLTDLSDRPRTLERGPKHLYARELDAKAAYVKKREQYRDAVDELFESLAGRSGFDIAYDRAVLRDIFDLAPPGLDELFAVLSVIDALLTDRKRKKAAYDRAIIDTAPTGHAMRLLELPAMATEWVHVFMRIVLKYREVIGLGDLAQELLELSRQLRELEMLLHDPSATAFVAVTRAAALPRLETLRLLEGLERLEIAPAAIVVNAITPRGCAHCRRARLDEAREVRRLERAASLPLVLTPALARPPRGIAELDDFRAHWIGRATLASNR